MTVRRRRPRWPYALALFFLSPFVGEFLLGNQPITVAPWALALATMYGGGAVLVREIGRRTGGWPAMFLLAAAYALLEEGPIDQMLFNPAYLGLESFAPYHAPVPGLGISAGLTVSSVVLHTVWSICVPIAIIEACDPVTPTTEDRSATPWLGRVGLTVVAVVFVVGSSGLALTQYDEHLFMGTPAQFVITGIAIGALICAGLTIGRRGAANHPSPGIPAPRPRTAAVVAFLVTSLYWLVDVVGLWFVGAWTIVAVKILLAAAGAVWLVRWSRRDGWGRRHRFAVAAGTLLTYVWYGFVHAQLVGIPPSIALLGNTLFAIIAVVVLVIASRRDRRAIGGVGREVAAA